MSLSRRNKRGRIVSRWVMAAIYFLAGILHLVLTETFVAIVPDWVPAPQTVVLVTGVCELLGAVGFVLMILSFMCERYPIKSTTVAVIAFLFTTLLMLISRVNGVELACRALALVPLLQGMIASMRLHQFRLAHAK